MKHLIVLILISLFATQAHCQAPIDYVLVKKSERKMFLIRDGRVIKHYRISLGGNPIGHKAYEGDGRTPEGTYLLDFKNDDSAFYKSIHISYPNDDDLRNAKRRRFNPGGQIMIHGQKNGYGKSSRRIRELDWTDGCIAVTNSEMEEIWELVEIDTPIKIEK